tara:strand:- start:1474 stop:1761 length:288 start_codon:yes stop_codon:yes gene_type:complete
MHKTEEHEDTEINYISGFDVNKPVLVRIYGSVSIVNNYLKTKYTNGMGKTPFVIGNNRIILHTGGFNYSELKEIFNLFDIQYERLDWFGRMWRAV